MQQAVLITAYTNIEHLFDIVNSLDSNFRYYIHLDKKTKIADSDLNKLLTNKNVALVSQQYEVNWGSINHVKAILLLLEKALTNKSNEYFHLITGHDYPIKNPSEITAFLKKNNGADFFEYFKLPYNNWKNGGYDRILYYNVYDWLNARSGWRSIAVRLIFNVQKNLGIKRSFPTDFPKELYGGSTYWTLSRRSIEYVFEYIKEKPSFLKRFKHTFCCEEMFFQTIIMNSPLKDMAINNNKRFIVWEKRNGNFPANLDDTDFDEIIESDAFFARKFDFPASSSLLQKIKRHLNEGTINHN